LLANWSTLCEFFKEDSVLKESNARKGLLLGLFLVALVGIPVISPAEQSTPSTDAEKSQAQASTKQDSSAVTFSDVGNWLQRSGNRVGEELSKAASKTASAIKKAVSGSKPGDRSEDSQ